MRAPFDAMNIKRVLRVEAIYSDTMNDVELVAIYDRDIVQSNL